MKNKEDKAITMNGEGLEVAGGEEEGSLAQEWHWKWERRGSWLPRDGLFFLWLLAPLHPHLFQSELRVQLNFHRRTWLGLLRDFLFPIFP